MAPHGSCSCDRYFQLLVMLQSKLSFPKYENKDEIPDGYSFAGKAIQSPTVVLLTPEKKKRKKKKGNGDNDSYEEESGNPEKKKRQNKSKIYSAMAASNSEKKNQPKPKRGMKKGMQLLL